MFEQRLKSHHELFNITKALAAGRMEVAEYLKTSGLDRLDTKPKAVLYVHIPYCRKICRFCNMLRMPGDPPEDYAGLLIQEIEEYGKLEYIQALTFDAVYFGGGTPTTLETDDLLAILTALNNNFRLADDVEITVESSVTELTDEKLESMKKNGVNRLSIGVQTFSDRGRRILGRTGTGKEAYEKLLLIKSLGFLNLNIDLIYHYSGQSTDELDEDLRKIYSLDLGGFSFYSLIENPVPHNMDMGIAFEKIKQISTGMIDSDNGSTDRELFDRVYSGALDQGFCLLELTKLVRHDQYRYISERHCGTDTLAIGAGAGGNLGEIVYMNPISPEQYRSMVVGKADGREDKSKRRFGILTKDPYSEVTRLTGALQRGVLPWNQYSALFGDESHSLLQRLQSEGYLEERSRIDISQYHLTQKGVYWGNNICDALLRSLELKSAELCNP